MRPGAVCPTCGRATDPEARERAAGRLPPARSLFLCRECRLPVRERRLPPAVAYHPGRVWSSDPSSPSGVALFYDPAEDAFTLTSWQTPFLESPPQRLSRSQLKKLFGLE
jgi:hypothetical protein